MSYEQKFYFISYRQFEYKNGTCYEWLGQTVYDLDPIQWLLSQDTEFEGGGKYKTIIIFFKEISRSEYHDFIENRDDL